MADSNRPENNEHKESQEIESLPSSDQLENSVAESLKSFELSDISDSQSSSLKSKLIQHLTGVSRVLQEMSNEVQELAKKNDAPGDMIDIEFLTATSKRKLMVAVQNLQIKTIEKDMYVLLFLIL